MTWNYFNVNHIETCTKYSVNNIATCDESSLNHIVTCSEFSVNHIVTCNDSSLNHIATCSKFSVNHSWVVLWALSFLRKLVTTPSVKSNMSLLSLNIGEYIHYIKNIFTRYEVFYQKIMWIFISYYTFITRRKK